MKRSRILNCEHCGRQIVSGYEDDQWCIGGRPPIYLVRGFCCHKCSEDFDENGNLPEELGYTLKGDTDEILLH